ncbi:MAG: transcriptional regulator NrdR [Syntrophales bacterium]|nr:transcriptional regulator NrdR [Syntrophales bacterium]
MKCPLCGKTENKVVDSRLCRNGGAIRRRRECLVCEGRFTTYEFVEDTLPVVIKKDGRRESFDRKKILTGIKKACEKRPISSDTIESTVESIEQECQNFYGKEISSSVIGEKVMGELQKLDGVAYVRFASVYREFRDVSEFLKELKTFMSTDKASGKG